MGRHQDPSRHLDELIARDDFVRRLAQSLTQRGDDADDAAQETWLASLATSHEDGLRPTRSWLAFVVRRMLAHGRRGRARRAVREAAAARAETIPSVQRIAEREELRRHLVEAVHALAPEQRDVVLLRYFEGLPPRQIAEELGVSLECVRSRLKRALNELRERLDAESTGGRARWMTVLGAWAWKETALVGSGAGLALKGVFFVSTKLKAATSLIVLCLAVALLIHRFANDDRRTELAERGKSSALVETRTPDAVRSDAVSETPTPATDSVASESTEPSPDETTPTVTSLTSLRICVLSSGGSPLVGVGVDVHRMNDVVRFPARFSSETDASGWATVENIADGEYSVSTDRGGAETEVTIKHGAPAECTVTLIGGIDIVGEVVDGDGTGIPNAEIILLQGSSFPGGRIVGRTDADGGFEVREVSWAMGVGARAAGRAPSAFVSIDSRAKVTKTRQVRLVLDRVGGDAAGIVVDADDDPVPGAVIVIGKESQSLFGVPLEGGEIGFAMQSFGGRTNAGGAFRLEGLPTGDYPIEVRKFGLAPWRSRIRIPEGSVAECRAVLVEGARVVGRIRRADGESVAWSSIFAGDPRDTSTTKAYVEENGDFAMDHLEPIPTVFTAKAKDGARDTIRLDLIDGVTTRWDAVLDLGRTITGRVENKSGSPACGYFVHLWRSDQGGGRLHVADVQSGIDGRFRFAGLDDVGYEVCVNLEFNRVLASAPGVRPSPDDVVLVVELGRRGNAKLRGVVVDEAGRPVADAWVHARLDGSDTGSFIERSDAEGRFLLDRLDGGMNELVISSRDHVMRSIPSLLLVEGKTYDAGTIVLETGGTFEVAIRRQDGGEVGAVPLASVRLDEHGEPTGPTRSFLATGESVQRGRVPPGRYRLLYGPPAQPIRHWDVDVRAGEVARLSIEIGAAVRRVIRIVEGKTSSDARLVCTLGTGAGNFAMREIDRSPDGAFIWELSVDPGSYVLEMTRHVIERRIQNVDLEHSGAPESPLVIEWP